MKCPVCTKEINRPLHITKTKDEVHKQYVISQKELAVELLRQGIPLVDIQNDSRIIIVSAVTDFLYANHKEELNKIGREIRNQRISKANYKDGGLREARRREIDELVKNGIEGIDYVSCRICNLTSTNISSHVTRVHKMLAKEYKELYPDGELFCENTKNILSEHLTKNNPNDNPESIKKMILTKAGTKSERVRKAKEQFERGERKVSDNVGRGVVGIRSDLGHNCRSMWEANIARILKLKNIEYEFEHGFYSFHDTNGNLIDNYLPDFYLPEYNAYLEVKGQMDDASFRKLELFEAAGYRVII